MGGVERDDEATSGLGRDLDHLTGDLRQLGLLAEDRPRAPGIGTPKRPVQLNRYPSRRRPELCMVLDAGSHLRLEAIAERRKGDPRGTDLRRVHKQIDIYRYARRAGRGEPVLLRWALDQDRADAGTAQRRYRVGRRSLDHERCSGDEARIAQAFTVPESRVSLRAYSD